MDAESLEAIAGRIDEALRLVIELLRDGIEVAAANAQDRGYDSADDMSYFNHEVRRYVREHVRAYFPTMPKAAPMSPIHLDLGPYHLKVLHAEDGSLPYPKTAARERFYGLNDLGLFALNVFPPDQLYVLEEDAEAFREGALVLIWDSEGSELTQATLIEPSRSGPDETLDLLTPVGVAEDLDEIRIDGEATESRQTATGDDEPETPTADGDDESDGE